MLFLHFMWLAHSSIFQNYFTRSCGLHIAESCFWCFYIICDLHIAELFFCHIYIAYGFTLQNPVFVVFTMYFDHLTDSFPCYFWIWCGANFAENLSYVSCIQFIKHVPQSKSIGMCIKGGWRLMCNQNLSFTYANFATLFSYIVNLKM